MNLLEFENKKEGHLCFYLCIPIECSFYDTTKYFMYEEIYSTEIYSSYGGCFDCDMLNNIKQENCHMGFTFNID